MQIAIVTSEFGSNAGGLSYGCYRFAEILSDLSYEIIIISSTYEKWDIDSSNLKFPVIENKLVICDGGYKKDLKGNLFFRAHLKNVLYEMKEKVIDYVVAFGAGYNGLFASEISRNLNIEFILLLRGSEINLTISDVNLQSCNYQCLKNANKVIALSKELLERSKQIYYNLKIDYRVIPNFIDSCRFIAPYRNEKETIILGCGSKHLNEKKGVANLISMMPYLNKSQTHKFKFEFAGKIDPSLHQEYQKLIKELNIDEFVDFIGDLSRNEFIGRMRTWDFYVQGSFCEGFSNAVGDYLSLGKAFLISSSGFIAETLGSDFNMLIFDNFIPEQMANKILCLIQNDNINSIYHSAYKKIEGVMNKTVINKNWETVFIHNPKKITSFKLSESCIISIVLHDIAEDKNSNINTNIQTFQSFVQRIFEKGFKLCSVRDYFSCIDRSNLIICTFDDGYEGVKDYALPLLKKFGYTATVFICTEYIGKKNYWNFKDKRIRNHLNLFDLYSLKKEGWEIGSHGISHNSLLKLSDRDLQNEIIISKKILENEFGEISSYAYPYGDFNEFCKSQVALSYKYAFALSQGGLLNGIDNYQIRRYFISEILSQLD